jgi:hypothetical protein
MGGEPVGIAGRRRPAIPYQAYNLTQTTTFNLKTGKLLGEVTPLAKSASVWMGNIAHPQSVWVYHRVLTQVTGRYR